MFDLSHNSIGEVWRKARRYVAERTTEREAEQTVLILLEHYFQATRTSILTHGNRLLSESEIVTVYKALKKLRAGVPVQYIIGFAFFSDLKLNVNSHVLIPRPETEELVMLIVKDHPGKAIRLLDIGTGSGCIPLAVKHLNPNTIATATDCSGLALDVAKSNGRLLNLNVNWVLADVLNETPPFAENSFEVVVSNPPYIPEKEAVTMPEGVTAHEPHLALFVPDNDPFVFYKEIARQAQKWLVPGGRLYVEVHEDFGREIFDILVDFGFSGVDLLKDLQGKDRMIRGTWLKNQCNFFLPG